MTHRTQKTRGDSGQIGGQTTKVYLNWTGSSYGYPKQAVSPASQLKNLKKESNATTPYAYGNSISEKLSKGQRSKITLSYPTSPRRYVFERVMTFSIALECASAVHQYLTTLQRQVYLKIHDSSVKSSEFIQSTVQEINPKFILLHCHLRLNLNSPRLIGGP